VHNVQQVLRNAVESSPTQEKKFPCDKKSVQMRKELLNIKARAKCKCESRPEEKDRHWNAVLIALGGDAPLSQEYFFVGTPSARS